ncbi:MAG: response regulator transcription factor [Chloroflexi bacterium AL-W]|nr:response regulator transcription factor [Chloroflexi bacterium AL-N1]NOK64949.1 response regulator transcription factor [Chloroflexi bacterium AL-N10]NOK76719.1 response regulator transcription factor [Chloroflexi bacterium AL-N5]NOK84610.1 response regulator transcription factor [Chloroflexi bacterium AL-W]NOK86565.1 response regulator transcription factor [Chloroflexi bacterium AL-N15]
MSILIADDDVFSVKLTSFLLEEAGYRVLKAYNGADVLEMLHEEDPDLILLDVSMPQSSGFDVCRRIRRMSDVPIIFLTANTRLEDRVLGLQIGGDDYMIKPFEPQELLARIEAVLRRSNNELLNTSVRLNCGTITLDPVEHKVLFADERMVSLTPIEFRLLYYLMKNSGRVLTSEQILDKVWGYDNSTGSNLVAVYIRRLRNKIEVNHTSPQTIVTIPYLGYKFEAPIEQAIAVNG